MAEHRNEPDKQRLKQPWKEVARNTIVAGIGLLPILPSIAQAADIDQIPAVAAFLAVVAAISRILAIPAVDAWLDRFAPWLTEKGDDHERKK